MYDIKRRLGRLERSLERKREEKREEKALKLWQEFFDRNSDPFVVQEYWGEDLQCYFCDGKPDHDPDCIYIRAKALIKGIENEN